MGEEIWKPIPGYTGYEASTHGRIRSIERSVTYNRSGKTVVAKFRPRIMKLVLHSKKGRHLNVTLGSHAPRLVHHLVMITFAGPMPEGLETRHLDGDGANNFRSNLCYGTTRENRNDDVRNGIYDNVKGENARNVKLTEAQVLEIKSVLQSGEKRCVPRLAKKFGVSPETVRAIKAGRNWAHL